MKKHPSYRYAKKACGSKSKVPAYVKKQCKEFIKICDGKSKKFFINTDRVEKIDKILMFIRMPKGLKINHSIYDCVAGFQWVLIIASLCVMCSDNEAKRRYETVVLEIARKNGKTFTIAVLFILLFFLEPMYSYFYSVAPDGSLSREIKKAIEEIIGYNPKIFPKEGKDRMFKVRRDDIECFLTNSKYIPLNYSNSRLDGKLPNVFLVDEVGALPNPYAIEAMRSGQLTILNKLGFIISTKYPTANNPFEDEVLYCKKVLDGFVKDDKVFSLLYEPDDKENWTDNDNILAHANPLALEIKEMWQDLLTKRQRAIEVESARENFLTKHCNIIYQGIGTESYIDINKVKKCSVKEIDWTNKRVWLGVDLAQTNDNCAVAIAGVDDEDNILASVMAFIPEGRIDEKSKFEHVDYRRFVEQMKCIACGDMVVDYGVIEEFVFNVEAKLGCEVVAIGYDRYNAMSSAQKWNQKYTTVEIRQHSDTLHPPTKLLAEKVENGQFRYEANTLLEINFENAKCTYDTNMNRYVNKKKSSGKVDMVVALINAIYLVQQDIMFNDGFVVQVV
ncbi:terminase [Catonella sp. Marseille-Q4567]|uniref:Terminase n=1 Tax=Catonella massiliensis TaxID=2799636 RepID=A0ABS1J3C1_9FIRM|nr:terminase [Catonella massiliensis]